MSNYNEPLIERLNDFQSRTLLNTVARPCYLSSYQCYNTDCIIDCECRPMDECESGVPILFIIIASCGVLFLISLIICHFIAKKRRAQRAAMMNQMRAAQIARHVEFQELQTRPQIQEVDLSCSQAHMQYDNLNLSAAAAYPMPIYTQSNENVIYTGYPLQMQPPIYTHNMPIEIRQGYPTY